MNDPQSVLDGLLDRVSHCIRGEGESELLSIRDDDEMQNRIDYLAQRCNEGVLSPDEHNGYKGYIQFGNFIAIL